MVADHYLETEIPESNFSKVKILNDNFPGGILWEIPKIEIHLLCFFENEVTAQETESETPKIKIPKSRTPKTNYRL